MAPQRKDLDVEADRVLLRVLDRALLGETLSMSWIKALRARGWLSHTKRLQKGLRISPITRLGKRELDRWRAEKRAAK